MKISQIFIKVDSNLIEKKERLLSFEEKAAIREEALFRSISETGLPNVESSPEFKFFEKLFISPRREGTKKTNNKRKIDKRKRVMRMIRVFMGKNLICKHGFLVETIHELSL